LNTDERHLRALWEQWDKLMRTPRHGE